jgi:hypothetical protein
MNTTITAEERDMSIIMFNVGEVCVHRGYICRVDAVERIITGQNGYPSRAYMGIEDGTELNPILTLTPLYGPDGEPVKDAKTRKGTSGAAVRVQDALKDKEAEVARLQKIMDLLRGVSQ